MYMAGPSSTNDRVEFWTKLSRVASLWKKRVSKLSQVASFLGCPWVLGGDFNCIRFPLEKKRKFRD